MSLKVEIIRRMPWSDLKPGTIIESEFAWYLVDLGYASPLNFERQVDPVKATRLRRRFESWYEELRKSQKAKVSPGYRGI